jgi:hypothetical protein
MLAATDARLEGTPGYSGGVALDLESPAPGAPAPAELVVSFRFLHHLPTPEHRARVLATLAGLSTRDVVISFHHPVSFHNLGRAFRRLFRGVTGDRYTLSPGSLGAEASAAGLEVVAFHPLARWRREFWLAHLRKR